MSSELFFHFGVEIELLIGSRSKSHKSWKSLAAEVSAQLAGAGIPNHINNGNDKSLENYNEWSIVQEVTVPAQAGKNLWGLELVSPIFNGETPWMSHLSVIFKTLKTSFTLAQSPDTSTHIHLSTVPALSVSNLAAIAKAVLFFEPALDALFPTTRASSYWCQSNKSNPVLKSRTLSECFDCLDWCQDTGDVVRSMCLYPAKSAYGRANGYTEDFVHGVYKWDFSGLDPMGSGNGTLEFRQCPGSRSAEEVKGWIELATGFAAGAIEGAGMIDAETQVTMEGLWWTISTGVQATGIGDLSAVEKLFQGGKKKKEKGSRK